MQDATRVRRDASGADSGDTIQAILAEIRSTKETAQGIAHNGPAPDADVPRTLAGLISHLAEQVERMASLVSLASATAPESQPDADSLEEDISPQKAPAEPARAREA